MTITSTWEDVLAGRAQWSFENRDGIELTKLLPTASIDHTIGDPPYDEKTHQNAATLKNGGGKIPIDFDHIKGKVAIDEHGEAFITDPYNFVPELLRCTKRWILQFCTQEMAYLYQQATKDDICQRKGGDRNYRRAQWWVRTNGAPSFNGMEPATPGETIVTMHSNRWAEKSWNGGGDRGYYIGPIVTEDERLGHPTQKPEWLMMKLIEKHTKPNEIIFDWSSGVATTGAAAIKLGRRFIGTELKGPCPKCGGGFPSSWNASERRKVLSLVNLPECPHGWINYYAIGAARLDFVSKSLKQMTLF